MPELPEVETIVRYLRPRLYGKQILKLETNTPRLFRDHRSINEVKNKIVGQRIQDLRRRGKNIIFDLGNSEQLAVHLMMSGTFLLNPSGERKHDRCILSFSENTKLVFNDPRKFGRWRIVGAAEIFLGEDALALSLRKFKSLIGARRGSIKTLLLNQNIISGIGNIYADEILWYAGIHPSRSAKGLTDEEIGKLYQAMRHILTFAIRKEGSSMRDYAKPDGSEGGYYEIRKVYQRTGEKCLRDGGIIQRLIVGSRSAHFCPKHQI